MTADRPVSPLRPYITDDQRRAADPATSVWVAASAGAGKTKALADRVLRLLLDGAAPERLLCLTFTRAAAAEMAIRINGELGNCSDAGSTTTPYLTLTSASTGSVHVVGVAARGQNVSGEPVAYSYIDSVTNGGGPATTSMWTI